MAKVLVVNGPNLNMLGTRQPEIYGSQTLADIETMCIEKGSELGLDVSCFQSNVEGELVEHIQQARGKFDAIVINAAAYTHTSVAIADALMMVDMPIVEMHLSNVHQREEFRHHSFISPIAMAVVCGFGAQGYVMALQGLAAKLS